MEARHDTPQVLLAHHLKTLLPTFLREYDKLARQCATEGADHVRYLVRLTELEPNSERACPAQNVPNHFRTSVQEAGSEPCKPF